MLLEVESLSCAYYSADVLQDVTLRLAQNEILGVIGPNGAGKSTLIRTMSRVLRPRLGRVELDDRDLYEEVTSKEAARSIAVVPQDTVVPFEFTAHEIVKMGRTPHLKRFEDESRQDLEIVQQAMEHTDTWQLRHRMVTELSGGERQRVLMARAFTQKPRVLLMDEPTTHLDLGHQVQIMNMIRELSCAVLATMHDLNLAAVFCHHLALLHEGRIVAAGTPKDVLTHEHLEPVYGIELNIGTVNGVLTVLPKRK